MNMQIGDAAPHVGPEATEVMSTPLPREVRNNDTTPPA
jgi:hypothetical protein